MSNSYLVVGVYLLRVLEILVNCLSLYKWNGNMEVIELVLGQSLQASPVVCKYISLL